VINVLRRSKQECLCEFIYNTYKRGPGLPFSIIAELKPIYNDLSKDELLTKCLHGLTQNANESLKITSHPKTNFYSTEQFEFGVYDDAVNFNIVLLYEKLESLQCEEPEETVSCRT